MMGYADLPPYSVRRSKRARRVRLTVSAQEGLTVVLPMNVPARVAAEAVSEKRTWAERSLGRVAERRAELLAAPDELLPSEISLQAFGETWPVEYRETESSRIRVRPDGSLLAVTGPIESAEDCLSGLRSWRDRTARERLPLVLAETSREIGIGYGRVSVRKQRTRWGSCSSAGTISLNKNLIFLPESVVRYVMIHELAHIHRPDHSSRFWDLVSIHVSDVALQRDELKRAWRYIPAWAEG